MTQIIIKTGLFNYNPLLLILAHCAMGIYTEDRPVNFRMAVILDDGITNGTRLIVTAFDDKRIDSEQQPIFYQEIKHDFFDFTLYFTLSILKGQ